MIFLAPVVGLKSLTPQMLYLARSTQIDPNPVRTVPLDGQ
jgi:hypothetical protein